MNPPPSLRRWAPPLLLLGVGCAVPWLLPRALGMVGPGGSDPGLWLVAAENLRVGASATTAPLYPASSAALAAVSGLPTATACTAVTVLCFALLPPVAWLLARRLGAGAISGVAAGVLFLALPSSLAFSVQIQADALTALVLLGVGLASVAFMRRPGWGELAGLAAAAAALSLVREHIVPMAGLMVLLALWPRGKPWVRALRALAVVAAVWIAPMLLGSDPGLPWQQTWFVDRVGEAARDATGVELPRHIQELPPHLRQPYEDAIRAGDRVGLMLLHLHRSLVGNWHAWLAVSVGFAGTALLAGRRRIAMAVVLLGLAPPLLAWSQPRHIAIFTPVAAAAWAAAFAKRGPRVRIALVVLALTMVGLVQLEWHTVARKQVAQAATRMELKAFGDELCSQLEPGAALMAGDARTTAYCPLPRVLGTLGTPYDWKLVWIGDLPNQHPSWASLEAGGWTAMRLNSDKAVVYRLRPWIQGPERPCYGSAPSGPFSYSRFGDMRQLPLAPPCEEDSPVTLRPAKGPLGRRVRD